MKKLAIITKKGIIKKIESSEVRTMGRSAKGVKGITLEDGDEVVAMVALDE